MTSVKHFGSLYLVTPADVEAAIGLTTQLKVGECCELLLKLDYSMYCFQLSEPTLERKVVSVEYVLRSQALSACDAARLHVSFWGGPVLNQPSICFHRSSFAMLTADKLLRTKQMNGAAKVRKCVRDFFEEQQKKRAESS